MPIAFFVFLGVVLVGGIIVCVAYPDRFAVLMIYRLNLNVYPMARSIARLLCQFPEQWSGDQYHLRHPKLGSIWIANEAYGLMIESEFGALKPNMIERRIIRDAVDWRLREYIRCRLTVALLQPVEKR